MSSTPPTPNSGSKPTESRRTRRRRQRNSERQGNLGSATIAMLFRLIVLFFGLGLGAAAGIALSLFYPKVNPSQPAIERWRVELTRQAEQRFRRDVEKPPEAPSMSELTPEQRQELQAEFVQLKADLAALQTRTVELTTAENLSETERTQQQQALSQQLSAVRSRLDRLESQLFGEMLQDTPASISSSPLHLTLPSDVLFTDDRGTVLDPTSLNLLDRLVEELQSSPNSSIYVAAYADEGNDRAEQLEITFVRAKQIVQHLNDTLDSDGYHWVSVGYGASQFVAPNDTPANRQRNRRIEIQVTP
ncbi:MAG: OmpA family protein [Cyanobacteria bacterium SID2]|nr:OmpA family protein [Cyanobacteria bacterium SID2]